MKRATTKNSSGNNSPCDRGASAAPGDVDYRNVEKKDEPLYHKQFNTYSAAKPSLEPEVPDEVNIEVETTGKSKWEKELAEDAVVCKNGNRKIDYILVYEESNTVEKQEKRRIFQENLQKKGAYLEIEVHEKLCYVKIHCPWHLLCKLAEIVKLKMPLQEGYKADSTSESCNCTCPFGLYKNLLKPRKKKCFTAPFDVRHREMFRIENREKFFTNAERSYCVRELLWRAHWDASDPSKFGIDRLLRDNVYKAAFPLHDGKFKYAYKDNTEPVNNDRELLYRTWACFGQWYNYQPLDLIKKYFGSKIGIYFTWLGFYTTMLIPASILGVLVFMYGCVTSALGWNTAGEDICNSQTGMGDTPMCPQCDKKCSYWYLKYSCTFAHITYVFDNEATALFAVFMVIWSIVFIEFWKRKQAKLQYRWDVVNYESQERVRPEFEAKVQRKKVNPLTKMMEPYLAWHSKLCRRLTSVSAVLLMVCLMVTGVFGVVVYRIIIVAIFYQMGNQDIRALAKIITSFTAAVVNLLFILVMIRICKRVAKMLTDMERCRTNSEYEDSYTIKVYMFEFVNFYATAFYIAFFKGSFVGHPGDRQSLFFSKWRQDECDPSGCLIELAVQLSVVVIGRQAFNNCQEILLPRLKVFVNTWSAKRAENQSKLRTRWEQDYVLDSAPDLPLFEEYLEMVIQYGFVTIFVAAFPLAPLIALINNILEIRIDANKFTTQWRHLPASRAQGIGIWLKILQGVTYLSVLTNGFVIAWTTDTLPRLIFRFTNNMSLDGYVNHTLSYFQVKDFPNDTLPDPTVTPGWAQGLQICRYKDYRNGPEEGYRYSETYWKILAIRLAFIIVFEHVVVLISLGLSVLIPDIPNNIKLKMLQEKQLIKEKQDEFIYQEMRAEAITQAQDAVMSGSPYTVADSSFSSATTRATVVYQSDSNGEAYSPSIMPCYLVS